MLVEKDATGSTNDDARQLALEGAPEGTAVLARAQTQGRGRAGRGWLSPEGGLYLSVILRPRLEGARWGLLPLALGEGAAAALEDVAPGLGVKWPNDLLREGRKVAGVLVETRLGSDGFVVAGIGVNLERAPLPEAAALWEGGPPRMTREEVARRIVAAWVEAARRLERAPAEALARVRARCVTLGKKVVGENVEGVAVDIDEDGALVVEVAGGGRARVVAGDVRVRQEP